MPRVLIAEDSPTQAAHLQMILEGKGYDIALARTGTEALEIVEEQKVDLVLTDLIMPEMNGLQVVEEISRCHPQVPVILMTEHGSEEIAAEALKKGAISYIPKRRIKQDLLHTLERVLGLTRADRRNQQLLSCWMETESSFALENCPDLIPHLVGYLRECLTLLNFSDEGTLVRVSLALTEALDNALHHGNLELRSEWREGDGKRWSETGQQRRQQSPYKERRIHVKARMSRAEAQFTIRDEGPGFDVSQLPDPTDPANLEKVSGRGIFLIQTFMDGVQFRGNGSEVSLLKRGACSKKSAGQERIHSRTSPV